MSHFTALILGHYVVYVPLPAGVYPFFCDPSTSTPYILTFKQLIHCAGLPLTRG